MDFEKNNTFTKSSKNYAKFGNICWYTNIESDKEKSFIPLSKSYKLTDYDEYCNFEGIDVKKIADIPKDYDGIMGVPFTLLSGHNPEQFEIIGLGVTKLGEAIGVGVRTSDEEFEQYKTESDAYRRNTLCFRNAKGVLKVPYSRVLIRRVIRRDDEQ